MSRLSDFYCTMCPNFISLFKAHRVAIRVASKVVKKVGIISLRVTGEALLSFLDSSLSDMSLLIMNCSGKFSRLLACIFFDNFEPIFVLQKRAARHENLGKEKYLTAILTPV